MTDSSTNEPQDASAPDAASSASPDHSAHWRFLEAEGVRPMVLFFWAANVGSLVGLVGGVFQLTLEAVGRWRDGVAATFESGLVLWWLLPTVFSAVVVFIAFLLVRRLAPETGGSGVQEIEGALDDLRPLRWPRVLPVKFFGGRLIGCAL